MVDAMPPSPEASTTRFEDVDLTSTDYLRGSSPMADVESPLSKTEPAGTSHVRGLSSVTGLPLGECATAPSKPKTPKKSKAPVKAAWVGRRTLAAGFFPFKPEETDRSGGARSSLAEFQARRATQVHAATHARVPRGAHSAAWGDRAWAGLPAVLDGFATPRVPLWHAAAHDPGPDVVRDAKVRLLDPDGSARVVDR